MHAKLDEILRALDQADSRLTNIDKLQPEEIERQRDRTRN
jgi:low affinity Fe/Cu permease